MTITESLLKEIELGRTGHNHGFSLGLPKLEGIIDGLTKGTLTVIGSNSGSGKTSFTIHSYVYRTIMEHLDDGNLKILYCSLEMNSNMIFAKLLSLYIFETYGKELPIKCLLSRKKNYILSDEDYEIVQKCIPWLNKIESIIEVYDKKLDADIMYALLMKRLETLGTFTEMESRKVYTPNNPDLIYEVIIDHIGLIPGKKQGIDAVIARLINLKNRCGISPTLIQQINRDQGNIERYKAGKTQITLNDFKETSDSTDAAEIVLALYNPNRDRLNTYKGYDVKKLGDHIRIIDVLKSRYGETDVEIGVNFLGSVCEFKELPLPNEIYDYDKYLTPDYILEKDVDEEKHEVDNSSKNEFKLIL